MSRIGKIPVKIHPSATVKLSGRTVTIEGPKGTLSIDHRPEVSVAIDEDQKVINVARQDDEKATKAYHGLTRALLQNMVLGVVDGFKKELDIVGVGWNAQVQGQVLNLNVGYADTRKVAIPAGLTVEVKGPRISVTGADKQQVGQFAAATRSHRPPEPYNGKGIKYVDEVIVRKDGKAFSGR